MKKLILTLLLAISWLGQAQCPAPTAVTVYQVTESSATIGWTSSAEEFLWEVLVLPAGSAPATGDQGIMATANPFVVTGLICAQYVAYVRSVCDGVPGGWSAPSQFSTSCITELMPMEFCDEMNDGAEFVLLTEYENVIQSILPPGNYSFSYYLSEADANLQTNPLPIYALVSTSMIFVRADDVANPGTFYLYSYMVILNPLPEYLADNSLTACDANGDGLELFNLNIIADQIYLNSGQSPNSWSVAFYETQADVMNETNPIVNVNAYANFASLQTLWVSITDNVTWCRTIAAFVLEAVSCDGISLTAFLDQNSNGTQDAGEPFFPYGSFNWALNGGNPQQMVSSTGQYFISDNQASSTYTLSYNVNTNYAASFQVTPSSATATGGSGVQEVTFAVSAISSFNDLSISIVPFQQPQLGFNYTNKVIYTNFGTSQQSGTVTFVKDPLVTIANMPPGAVANGTGFTYNFSNLMPFEVREFNVTMVTPTIPTVGLGQILTSSASITIPVDDIIPANNLASISQAVVGAYDPNDKVEAHGGQIVLEQFMPDEELIYTIRFENVGTASTTFINVEDELDPQLDASTLRMISASHDYALTKNGHSLNWFFEDAALVPTSQDPIASHGYITFAVKPLPGLAVGDIIPNTASIFFDFNPAIVTNTFETQFMAPLSTPGHSLSAFMIHPNPASEMVHITSEEMIGKISITDLAGKRVAEYNASVQNPSIDISMLQSGMYLIEIATTDGSRSVQKLIKN